MSDYSEWLLNLPERMHKLRKTLQYIYLTKMSIAWVFAFSVFIVFGCYEIRSVPMTYIFGVAGAIVGIALFVLMILSMTEEAKEVNRLRNLFHDFINSLANEPGNMWNPKTIEKFKEFQSLFKRIYRGASINVQSSAVHQDGKATEIARPKVIDNMANRVPKYLVVGNQYFHIPNVKTFNRLGEIFGFDWPDCAPMPSDRIKQEFTGGEGKQLPDISEFHKTNKDLLQNDSKWTTLDKLEGREYEGALEKLKPDELEQYLDDLPDKHEI